MTASVEGTELLNLFTVRIFYESLSICILCYFPLLVAKATVGLHCIKS